MVSMIRPNRLEVSDRFPILGFTVQTGASPKWFEIAIASDLKLFHAEAKAQRTHANFYSTRAAGPLAAERGEAVYLVPPEVLKRFAGQSKVYFGLATFADPSRSNTDSVRMPSEGSPYINIAALTGRASRRMMAVPHPHNGRSANGNGYSAMSAQELEWAGDAAQPGMQAISPTTTVAPPANGSATTSPAPSATAPATQPSTTPPSTSAALKYDDGFGPMPLDLPAKAARPAKPYVKSQARSSALSYDLYYEVPLVPQPDKLSCWAGSMAMLVGYRRNQSLNPETLAQEAGRSLRTSYGWDMLESVKDYFGFRDITLPSNTSLYPLPEDWQNWLSLYGPLWVTVVGAPSHAIIVNGISGDLTPAGTTMHILNPWDTTTNFSNDQIDFNPPNRGRQYSQRFEDFAADFGNLGLSDYGRWRVLYLPAYESQTQGQSLGRQMNRGATPARSRAQNTGQSFDANWNEVEVVPQLNNMSCWAAAASMVVGWRDRMSINPEEIANGAGQWAAYQNGLNPADVPALAQAWDLTIEYGMSYTVEGLRQLLETTGPLWVVAVVPGLHAIVVTGMYGDGTIDGTYVRIKDPWGRAPGQAGKPGNYNPTPGQGSAYDLTFRQFAEEYEGAANLPSVDIQILHSKPEHISDRYPTVSPQAYARWQSVQLGRSMNAKNALRARAAMAYRQTSKPSALPFSSDIPLDPGNGGRSIGLDLLQAGDIIVSTTADITSDLIRFASNAPVSHAMIYTGDGGQVVEAIRDGVVFHPLDEAIANATVAVAFRHPDLTEEQAWRIRDFVGQQIGKSYNYWGIVRQAGFQLDRRTFCSDKSGGEYDRCVNWAGRVNMGTATNDEFFCSQLVLAAYETAGVPLTSTPPHWNSPGDLAELRLSGMLGYVGHLKAPAVSMSYAQRANNKSFGNGRQRMPQYVQPLAIVRPEYQPRDFVDALQFMWEWIKRQASWATGVPDTSFFPHSAICHLNMTFDDGQGYTGTGFYIAPDCILTAAHNVVEMNAGSAAHQATSILVTPGKNGAGIAPFGSFNAASWQYHPSYNGGFDFDLAVIKVNTPPPHGLYFNALEELNQSIVDAIIVCGYAAESVDRDKQHLDGDTIRMLSDNGELFFYNLHTEQGTSGSPVYYVTAYDDPVRQMSVLEIRIIGVHVSRYPQDDRLNRGCRLTQDKINWIYSACNSGAASSQALSQNQYRSKFKTVGVKGAGADIVVPRNGDSVAARSASARARAMDQSFTAKGRAFGDQPANGTPLSSKEAGYDDALGETADPEQIAAQPAAQADLSNEEIYRIVREVVIPDSGDELYSAVSADREFEATGRHFGLGFGLALFTQESGRLGHVLQLMQQRDAAAFAEIFGTEAEALLAVTNAATPAERLQPIGGEVLWSEKWLERFRRAGQIPVFQAAQNEEVIAGQFRPMLKIATDLGFLSDRGLAMVYDRIVTRGLGAGLRWVVQTAGPLRTAMQRQHALQMLGYQSAQQFQQAMGNLPQNGVFGPETHAALVAALREQGAAALPSVEELICKLVISASGNAKKRLLRLRDSMNLKDIIYQIS